MSIRCLQPLFWTVGRTAEGSPRANRRWLRPTSAVLDGQQVGVPIGTHHLEAGPAAMGRRVPPALVGQPGTGPAHHLDPRPAAHRQPGRRGAGRTSAPDPHRRPIGVHHLAGHRLGGHGGRRRRRDPTGPRRIRPPARPTGAAFGRSRPAAEPGRRHARAPAGTARPARARPGARAPSPRRVPAAPGRGRRPATARSSSSVSPPQNPSWRPVAATTSSGIRANRMMPLVGR